MQDPWRTALRGKGRFCSWFNKRYHEKSPAYYIFFEHYGENNTPTLLRGQVFQTLDGFSGKINKAPKNKKLEYDKESKRAQFNEHKWNTTHSWKAHATEGQFNNIFLQTVLFGYGHEMAPKE